MDETDGLSKHDKVILRPLADQRLDYNWTWSPFCSGIYHFISPRRRRNAISPCSYNITYDDPACRAHTRHHRDGPRYLVNPGGQSTESRNPT